MDAELENLRELKKNLDSQLEKFPYREYRDLHNFLRYSHNEVRRIMEQGEKVGWWKLNEDDYS